MRIPEKGKPVIAGRQVLFSMGEIDSTKRLYCNYCSDLKGATKFEEEWQEVEITPVVRVPAEGTMVLCWNGDQRPKDPAVRYSCGMLNNGSLSVYDYMTPKGVCFGLSTAKHWEEVSNATTNN